MKSYIQRFNKHPDFVQVDTTFGYCKPLGTDFLYWPSSTASIPAIRVLQCFAYYTVKSCIDDVFNVGPQKTYFEKGIKNVWK